jgi:aryl-alcohol dehydrogenase-like predicted oxidoreductase
MTIQPEYVDFPVIGLKVSRIGFGCCPMGQHGWGDTDEHNLIKAVNAALDCGITFFDTSDVYGLGVSELVLGRALKGKRESAIIATKFGVRIENNQTFYDNSRKWINRAVNESLSRLGTDYIDLYQLHYWDNKTPVDEVLSTLQSLRNAGKIRAFGVTNIDLFDHGIKQPVNGLASFSFEYSLANRAFEPAVSRNQEKLELCFLSWGSLGQGILSGKYNTATEFSETDRRSRDTYVNFHGEKLVHNLRIVDYMRSILPYYKDKTLSQLAIRWILDQIPFSIALTGIKRLDQLKENFGALGWKLANEHCAKLYELSGIAQGISKNGY